MGLQSKIAKYQILYLPTPEKIFFQKTVLPWSPVFLLGEGSLLIMDWQKLLTIQKLDT